MSLLTSLASYWKLDEVSGNRADSVGSNTLTDTNTVDSTTGLIINSAVFVKANSESLDGPDVFDFIKTSDFSIQVWVKRSSANNASTDVLAGKGTNQYNIAISTANKINCAIPGVAGIVTESGTTTDTTTWHHAVLTHVGDVTNDVWNLYKDGALADSQINGSAMAVNANGFTLGREAGGVAFLNGQLDECGVWTRVLSLTEVVSLYNAGAGLSFDNFGGTSGSSLGRDFMLTNA